MATLEPSKHYTGIVSATSNPWTEPIAAATSSAGPSIVVTAVRHPTLTVVDACNWPRNRATYR